MMYVITFCVSCSCDMMWCNLDLAHIGTRRNLPSKPLTSNTTLFVSFTKKPTVALESDIHVYGFTDCNINNFIATLISVPVAQHCGSNEIYAGARFCPSASTCSHRDPFCLEKLASPVTLPTAAIGRACSNKKNAVPRISRPISDVFRSTATEGHQASSGWVRPVAFWFEIETTKSLSRCGSQPDAPATEHRHS